MDSDRAIASSGGGSSSSGAGIHVARRASTRRVRTKRVAPEIVPDTRDFSHLDDAAARDILATLQRDGYCDVSARLLPPADQLEAMRSLVEQCVRHASAGAERSLHTERTAINIPVKRCLRPLLSGLLGPTARTVLGSYLFSGESDWVCVGVQSIKVKPHLQVQKFHRDHQHGKGMCLVLAISLDDIPLRTLFVKGTHAEHDTLPPSLRTCDAARIQEERLGAAAAVAGRMMVYDPHTLHAGGANPEDQWYCARVFATFVSAELSAHDRRDLKMTNGLTGFAEVRRGDLLAALETQRARGGQGTKKRMRRELVAHQEEHAQTQQKRTKGAGSGAADE